jgi:hypothetical protein
MYVKALSTPHYTTIYQQKTNLCCRHICIGSEWPLFQLLIWKGQITKQVRLYDKRTKSTIRMRRWINICTFSGLRDIFLLHIPHSGRNTLRQTCRSNTFLTIHFPANINTTNWSIAVRLQSNRISIYSPTEPEESSSRWGRSIFTFAVFSFPACSPDGQELWTVIGLFVLSLWRDFLCFANFAWVENSLPSHLEQVNFVRGGGGGASSSSSLPSPVVL